MKKLLIALAVLAVLGVVSLFAFGPIRSSSDSSDPTAARSAVTGSAMKSEMAPDTASRAALKTNEAGASDAITPPAVIRRASFGIASDNIPRDLGVVRGVATAAGGHVENESSSRAAGVDHASLRLRVPNAAFESVLAKVAQVGEVTRRDVSSEDVTTQVIDIEAKVRAQRASVASLEKLMAKARTVGEVMAVERELSQRQGELDSLVQQQRYLKDQTAMSTVEVTLSSERPVVAGSGFGHGLKTGWKALGDFFTGAATAAGVLLPFVPLLALAVAVSWLLWRRSHRLS